MQSLYKSYIYTIKYINSTSCLSLYENIYNFLHFVNFTTTTTPTFNIDFIYILFYLMLLCCCFTASMDYLVPAAYIRLCCRNRAHMKLTIKNLQNADFGNYRCISKNSLGETEGSIRVYGTYYPAYYMYTIYTTIG